MSTEPNQSHRLVNIDDRIWVKMVFGTAGKYGETKTDKVTQKTTLIIIQLRKLFVESGNFCIRNSNTPESLRNETSMNI